MSFPLLVGVLAFGVWRWRYGVQEFGVFFFFGF